MLSLVDQVQRLEADVTFYRDRAERFELIAALASQRADRFQQRVRELYEAHVTADGAAYLSELRALAAQERAVSARLQLKAS